MESPRRGETWLDPSPFSGNGIRFRSSSSPVNSFPQEPDWQLAELQDICSVFEA